MARITMSVRDYSDEYGRVTFPVAEPIATQTEADLDAIQADLEGAVGGVTLGEIAKGSFTLNERGNDARPASALAQREFGLRIFYHDNVTLEKYNLTIPAVDIASLTVIGGSDLVDLTVGAMATLVTSIENNVRVNGNAVTVDRALIVGRNS